MTTTPQRKYRVVLVVAARPNMMKAAPILAEMAVSPRVEPLLVHTGQHYDYSMSQVFFEELELPEPTINLEVGGGTHHEQTGEVIRRFGEYVRQTRPDCVVVLGDVNATAACSLVAAKEQVPLVHVESGLRSFDRAMPEEINRIVADSLADLLLVTERSGLENLKREGIADERVELTGNVMIDSLSRMLPRAQASNLLDRMQLRGRRYALITLHRPSNVDSPEQLLPTLQALRELAQEMPVIFPVHPRTQQRIRDLGFGETSASAGEPVPERGLCTTPPLAYRDFVALMEAAALVITDSGGIQEETTYLGVPCLTFRDNTERPITVEMGTNRLMGADPGKLVAEARHVLQSPRSARQLPPLWDGHAAKRVVSSIVRMLDARSSGQGSGKGARSVGSAQAVSGT